jgi:hypothetical protein
MRYIIYCDESDTKGPFYSNFYGGALLRASDRERIEERLKRVKDNHGINGELKWTKICEYNEKAYFDFLDELFNMLAEDLLKIRIMFTQNINQTSHIEYDESRNEFLVLYYLFIKTAFGLRHCNPARTHNVHCCVYLDEVPTKRDDFTTFKRYLSSLSDYPVFNRNKIKIDYNDITDVDSKSHVILQAVDIVLGAMHFRLNEFHKAKPDGSRRRAKRTRAKERVYRHINKLIREYYPHFNVGATTGQKDGPEDKWRHPYRHWCFVPTGSKIDRSRAKKRLKKK